MAFFYDFNGDYFLLPQSENLTFGYIWHHSLISSVRTSSSFGGCFWDGEKIVCSIKAHRVYRRMIVRMCEYELVNNGSYQQTFGDWLSADEQTNAWGDGKCPPPPKRTDTMDLFLLTTTKHRCDDSGNENRIDERCRLSGSMRIVCFWSTAVTCLACCLDKPQTPQWRSISSFQYHSYGYIEGDETRSAALVGSDKVWFICAELLFIFDYDEHFGWNKW